jgi:hypothetical protein
MMGTTAEQREDGMGIRTGPGEVWMWPTPAQGGTVPDTAPVNIGTVGAATWTDLGTADGDGDGLTVAVDRQGSGWWHVVWCLDCTTGKPGQEIPFSSEQARAEWKHGHEQGTGHGSYRLRSVRRRP